MKSIWKFPLDIMDEQKVFMPEDSLILSVQVQNGVPCIWAMVDTGKPKIDRTFVIVGTGQLCDMDSLEFIGTFQMFEGNLVFHLFEKVADIG